MNNLKLEEAEEFEQQLKTLVNGEIKILIGDEHQFRWTIKNIWRSKLLFMT